MKTQTRLNRYLKLLVIPFLLSCLAPWTQLMAAPLQKKDVPQPLRDWVEWVSQGHENRHCPFVFNDWKTTFCAWPGVLRLDLSDNGGRFSQSWQVYHDSWIRLPGNQKIWPQQVQLNKKDALLVQRNGTPMIFLKAGEYQVQGRFAWQQAPTILHIPDASGIVDLSFNNKHIDFPRRENAALWLQAERKSKSVNRLDFQVYRYIEDSIPAQVTIRLSMQVSGVARQESLQLPVGASYIPLTLQSDLPARLNEQNQLTLQVRPGKWNITLRYRLSDRLSELRFDKPSAKWVEEEVWAFRSRPSLRIVDVSGMQSIDPQQAELPAEWGNLPAYRAMPGDSLKFKVERRGDPNPGDDQLDLHRSLWLSFDGDKYTIVDNINGTKKTQWRMEMKAPLKLGQVSINGQDQFITKAEGSDKTGVEIREGNVNLFAASELANDSGTLPATGWAQNFRHVATEFNLPPGYRVFSVTGADNVSSTWLTSWSLMDIFLVLLITVAVGKLRGKIVAAIAFFTLLLSYHEYGAPVILWLLLVFALALLRVIKSGAMRKLVLIYHYGVIIALVIAVIPFLVQQIRTAIYPQLESESYMTFRYNQAGAGFANAPLEMDKFGDEVQMERRKLRKKAPMPAKIAPPPAPLRSQEISDLEGSIATTEQVSSYAPKRLQKIVRYDPNAVKQTGPGIPAWRWQTMNVSWSGPVDQNQALKLIYITPGMNKFLTLLRVILVIALLLGLLGFDIKQRKLKALSGSMAGFACMSLLAGMLLTPTTSQAQQFPSQDILQELEKRLYEPAECLPHCADIVSMKIDLAPQRLSIDLVANALEQTAIPLPGDRNRWHIDKILLDGKRFDQLIGTNGRLYLSLKKGQHRINLQGKLSADNKQQFEMPLKPHTVSVSSKGWEVAGIHPDGSIDRQLQFSRTEKSAQAGATNQEFDSSQLPGFVKIKRRFIFGLKWTLQTTVERVSASGNVILLNVPLIQGESVLTPDIKVENGAVKLNMSANAYSMYWESNLAMSDAQGMARQSIDLQAAKTTQWTEEWIVDASPIWHVEYKGLPVIHHISGESWQPNWLPWPGESLHINISRPVGIAGQNITIDNSRLNIEPGLRLSDAKLQLDLRSNQGGKHLIQLPPESKLQEVKMGGRILPLRLEKNALALPISPGSQHFDIFYQVPEAISSHFKSFPVDLGLASVNHEIQIALPQDRWILFVNGPRLGPAVLIWGLLIVILLLAFPLSRLRRTIPLKYWQWSLLVLGLLPISMFAMFIVIAWFLLLSFRETINPDISKWKFNLFQIVILGMTIASIFAVGSSLSSGLLGSPDMHIAGNGSYAYSLRWYQDIVAAQTPQASVYSIPMYFYRIFMLLWALWMAFSLVRWSQWAWKSFSTHGYWRSVKIALGRRGGSRDSSSEGSVNSNQPPSAE